MIKEFKNYTQKQEYPISMGKPITARGFYKYQIVIKSEEEFHQKMDELIKHLEKNYKRYKILGVEKAKYDNLIFDHYIITMLLDK